jgi:hypothetical protein
MLVLAPATTASAHCPEDSKPPGSTAQRWNDLQAKLAHIKGEWHDEQYKGSISNLMPDTALLGNARVATSMTMDGAPLEMDTWLASDSNVLVTSIKSYTATPVELSVSAFAGSVNTRTTYTNTAGASGGTATRSFTIAPDAAVQIVTVIACGGQNAQQPELQAVKEVNAHHTRDHEFLRETAYPMLRKTADFFANYLEWNESTQKYALSGAARRRVRGARTLG